MNLAYRSLDFFDEDLERSSVFFCNCIFPRKFPNQFVFLQSIFRICDSKMFIE
ncbi:hypothetical protein LEP1GSC059_0253 [Leptospira noguchii serovar Panama str. CZ214]|uniref:Uncharacterized protein n=1 Tax=Leptospira noguchii serovar Panama str. CZ214 TaxID=1001595 RepID=T0FVG1_9LEPT|nr:hypothetical protein LEP1GSC059_0253 [Leptospira noguchii serovar Panama str. CZ214]